MRNPGGYLILSGEGPDLEFDTFTCKHCNCVTIVKSDTNIDFCRLCMAAICSNCAGKPCTPFEKILERMEAAGQVSKWL